jgi:hypothetical protein
MKTTFFQLFYSFQRKYCEFSKPKVGPKHYQCLESIIPPHLSTQNQDMCHDTIGSNQVIEMQSQFDRNFGTL